MNINCSVLSLLLLINLISATAQNNSKSKLDLYGDMRFRTEIDRDSDRMDGSEREDRDRLRYRLRFGFTYQLSPQVEFGGRLRSGNPKNQQGPHVSFGDQLLYDEFSVDKAYIKIKSKQNAWLLLGKNGFPFWQQNEFLWDGDVNPDGISFGSEFKIGQNSSIRPVGGYYVVQHRNTSFGDDGRIYSGQLKLNSKIAGSNVVVSSGLIAGEDLMNRPDEAGSFQLDYKIWASSIQFKGEKFAWGFDYFSNLTSYNSNANIDQLYKNEKNGYVGSLIYQHKKVLLGYYYAHIEKYAVIDYISQDDWVRWGNIDYTRSSNLKGHELRMRYAFNSKFNTVLRAYFVDGIETTGTHLESGTRVRLDFNIRF